MNKSIIELLGEAIAALENTNYQYKHGGITGDDISKNQNALTTLTEVMERLESDELVEEVARACCLAYSKEAYPNSTKDMINHIVDKDWEWYQSEARAAIATIKGE